MALKDFVKTIKKSALLAHLKGVDEATAKWRKDLLDAVVTKDELVIQMDYISDSHDDLTDRDLDEQHPATAVSVSVTGFDGNLSAADTDVQLALDTLDDLVINDENAIHDNVSQEISAISEKTVPVVGDLFVIEDSEDSFTKKSLQMGNIRMGGSQTDDAIEFNAIEGYTGNPPGAPDEYERISIANAPSFQHWTDVIPPEPDPLAEGTSSWRSYLGTQIWYDNQWQENESAAVALHRESFDYCARYNYREFEDGTLDVWFRLQHGSSRRFTGIAVMSKDAFAYSGGLYCGGVGYYLASPPYTLGPDAGNYLTTDVREDEGWNVVGHSGEYGFYTGPDWFSGKWAFASDGGGNTEVAFAYHLRVKFNEGWAGARQWDGSFGVESSLYPDDDLDWDKEATFNFPLGSPCSVYMIGIESPSELGTATYTRMYYLRMVHTVDGIVVSDGLTHADLLGLANDDHLQYLLADGTRELVDDWDAGTYEIKARTFESDVATGTAPLTIASTTVVSNLNADLLDGQQGSYYLDHGNHTGLADDDHTQYVLRSQWKQNGFVSKDDITISWDDGTRTLSVTKTGSSFVYFEAGVAYTKTAVQTKQIDDTEGIWVFYFDGATLTAVNSPSDSDIEHVIENHTIVAYVYWDATNNDGRLFAEPHGISMAPSTHHYLHDVLGAQFDTGMSLGDILADEDGSSNTHAQFSTEAGAFYDEDIKHTTELTAAATGLEIYYFDGADLRWTTNSGYSFITYSGGSGRIAFNDSGSQTEVDNTKFVLAHVFASNIKDDDGTNYRLIAVQGQAQYATLSSAREGADTEILNLITGDLPMEELVPVATVIFQTADAYTNSVNARIRSTETGDDYVDWRDSGLPGGGGGGGTTPSDHGLLTGLADDDHTQYLLADGSRELSAAWDAGSFKITAETLESDVATGTAPLTVASTTAITNLNADLLDGSHAAEFSKISGTPEDGQVAVWVSASEIKGSTGLTEANAVTYIGDEPKGYLAVINSLIVGPPYTAITESDIDPATVLLSDGTVALAADWDAGSYEIRAQTFESDVATGTAPLTIASTTAVTNLNADLLDGSHASAFLPTALDSGAITMTVYNNTGSQIDARKVCYISGDSSGTPLITLADADAASSASKMLVIANANIANAASGSATVYGWVTGLSSLTAGAIQYLSTAVGDITETAPSGTGDIVRIVGYAMSTTEMFFNPDKTYIELV